MKSELYTDPNARGVLEERARLLAAQDSETYTRHSEQIVIFQLGGSGYCVPARWILEVLPLPPLARLPAAPPFLVGLVNVHGRLLVALDLRPLLEMPFTPPPPGAQLLVLRVDAVEVGLVADSVDAVAIGDPDVAPAPTRAGRGIMWARGVDHQLNLLLDPPLLLADLHQRLAGGAPA
jgi:purine-binding chemotaxis protein CheW